MPFVNFGTGWRIGIWAAPASQLPTEVFFALTIVPIVGFWLWRTDRRAKLIWIGVVFAIAGGLRYNLSLPHFDQNSLATYNNIGDVTIDGVIEADPDIRDAYINLRVKAARLALPDKSVHSIEGTVLVRPSRPAEFRYGDRVRARRRAAGICDRYAPTASQLLPSISGMTRGFIDCSAFKC